MERYDKYDYIEVPLFGKRVQYDKKKMEKVNGRDVVKYDQDLILDRIHELIDLKHYLKENVGYFKYRKDSKIIQDTIDDLFNLPHYDERLEPNQNNKKIVDFDSYHKKNVLIHKKDR